MRLTEFLTELVVPAGHLTSFSSGLPWKRFAPHAEVSYLNPVRGNTHYTFTVNVTFPTPIHLHGTRIFADFIHIGGLPQSQIIQFCLAHNIEVQL